MIFNQQTTTKLSDIKISTKWGRLTTKLRGIQIFIQENLVPSRPAERLLAMPGPLLDFRYVKNAKFSKLNNFYSYEYFFLKLHEQRVKVDSVRACEV